MKYIAREGNELFNHPVWNEIPEVFRHSFIEMQSRGIQESTEDTYLKNMKEFMRTMRRLGFNLDDVLVYPIKDIYLIVYMIDCALMRKKPNVWNTIRNKLASIDHYNKIAGTYSSWSENPTLENLVAFCKRNNPSDDTKTALPFMKDDLIAYVRFGMNELIYREFEPNQSMRPYDVHARKHYLITSDEIRNSAGVIFIRMIIIITAIMCLTGMRISENAHSDNGLDHKYGITFNDLDFLHTKGTDSGGNRLLYVNNKIRNDDTFHAVRIKIRNSKMRNTGKVAYAMIGRSNHEIDPALMLYDLYHCLRKYLSKIKNKSVKWNASLKNHVFQLGNGRPMTRNKYRIIHKKLCKCIGYFDLDRISLPHACRKGFASWLTQLGLPPGLIAYIARWKLPQAYYCYIIYYQHDMIAIANKYFNAKPITNSIDFDEKEGLYLMRMGGIMVSKISDKQRLLLEVLKIGDPSLDS